MRKKEDRVHPVRQLDGVLTMEHRGFTVWFTGLSGSGKTTIATRLVECLARRRPHVELLSGAEFRRALSHGLGFSDQDRATNVRRLGYVAKLLTRNGVAVVTTSISPHRATRDECRRMIGAFVEVYVDCPPEVCETRDRKGLWARARSGEIQDFTGVSAAYEAPIAPEVVCRSAEHSVDECAARVLAWLEAAGWLAPMDERTEPDAELVKAQLRALGES